MKFSPVINILNLIHLYKRVIMKFWI